MTSVQKTVTLLLLSIVLYIPLLAQPSKVKTIQLLDQKIKYVPADFYISGVRDERADTANIGFVKTGLSDKRTTLQLGNSTASSVAAFLAANMKQNKAVTPVELHIIKLDVSEKRVNGIDKADIDMGFAFYIQGEKTIELSSSAYVKSGLDATAYIEEMIRRQTESALSQFGDWFTENKAQLLSAPSVKVEVTVDNDPKDKSYIPYSPARPLTYDDFAGRPDKLSIGAAATASSVTLDASTLTKGKEVTIKLKVGALFNRDKSWFKREAMNAKVLAHEQLHFDITAYQACRFIETVRNFAFSHNNYMDELQQLRKQSERETEAMQDLYDEESDHGLIGDRQAAWARRIGELIKQQTCYR